MKLVDHIVDSYRKLKLKSYWRALVLNARSGRTGELETVKAYIENKHKFKDRNKQMLTVFRNLQVHTAYRKLNKERKRMDDFKHEIEQTHYENSQMRN